MRNEKTSRDMTVLEHLAELRVVLLQSILALTLASIGGWFVSEKAIEALIEPATQGVRPLVFFGPADALMLRMKVAVGIGLFACAPIVVWRMWSFFVPGLLRRERQALLPIGVGSLLLFYAGAAFAYFVMVPISIKFLLGFSTASLQPMISGDKYFDFLLRVTLSFAAVFQFPLVSTVLTMWGILPPDYLRRHWRGGVVVVFIAAAIFTPPDVASQLLMAGPLLLLYAIAVIAAALVAPRKQAALLVPLLLFLFVPKVWGAPPLPDLAVRRDGIVVEKGRVEIVVENLGNADAPATTIELWDRPPLMGPSGTSSPYPATRGSSAIYVFQEPISRQEIALDLVVERGLEEERSEGALRVRRGEALKLAREIPGVTLEAGGRAVKWSCAVPAEGLRLAFKVPATPGSPPAVELSLPARDATAPGEETMLPHIFTADQELHSTNAVFVLDALDRPPARRTRADCPALRAGERSEIAVDFEPGPAGEVYVCVDPDDRVLEGREGNNVASRKSDSDRWTQAVLHFHSSFSEGPGSIDWQAALATRSGYDLLWWSEHDWRISCFDHVNRIGFEEGETVGTKLSAQGAGVAEFSLQEPYEGKRSLRLAANGAGRAHADLSGERQKIRRLTYSLAARVTLDAQIFARGLHEDDRLRIVAELSHHPTEKRFLVYEYGPRDFPNAGWTRVSLPFSRDAEERWTTGLDDNISGLSFELISKGSGAEVRIDGIEIEHGQCGAELRRIQEEWMKLYPNVQHSFADEVSYLTPHLNQYGGPRGLFDYAQPMEEPYPEKAIERIHRAGGIVSYCHPFGLSFVKERRKKYGPAYRDSLIMRKLGGADILEVGFRRKATEDLSSYLSFWDQAGLRGVAVTGIGVSDSHEREWGNWENNFATWVNARADDHAGMLRALQEGRVFFGDPLRFRGRLEIEADGRQGGNAIPGEGAKKIEVRVTQAPPRSRMVLVVDGSAASEWKDVNADQEFKHELSAGQGHIIRAELWGADGAPLAFTNPLYSGGISSRNPSSAAPRVSPRRRRPSSRRASAFFRRGDCADRAPNLRRELSKEA